MDGGDNRKAGDFAQESAGHIGAGPVAVDDLKLLLPDVCGELAADFEDVVAVHDFGRDAERAGLAGKGTVPEADKLGGNGAVEKTQKAEDVGFRASGIAAADEMNDFHKNTTLNKIKIERSKRRIPFLRRTAGEDSP